MPSPRFATAPLSPIEASQRLRLQSALLCRLAYHIARMSADLNRRPNTCGRRAGVLLGPGAATQARVEHLRLYVKPTLHHVPRLAVLTLSLVMRLRPRAGEGKHGGPRAEAVQDEGGCRPLRNYRPRPGTKRRGSPQTGQRCARFLDAPTGSACGTSRKG